MEDVNDMDTITIALCAFVEKAQKDISDAFKEYETAQGELVKEVSHG